MASMVDTSNTNLEGGHMHTSLEDVQNNGGNHADGGSGNGNGGDGNSDPSLYDELEDLTGARQTLIQNRYTFWYYRKGARKKDRDPSGAYESGIKVVESFQTVEHFWRIYNHIVRADEVPNATDVHLFRHGIKPTWEDPQNARGGQLLVRMKKGLASRAWENLVLAIVGEQFDVGNELCGAVVSVRYSEDVISVWNRTASNTEGIEKMRDAVKRLLDIPPGIQVEYRRHQDNLGAVGVRGEGGGGFPGQSPGFGPRGGPPGAGSAWARHRDGDRAAPAAGNMPPESWARGPPEGRDRDRDGPGYRGGGGGLGGFRPSPGGWGERRERVDSGAKDYERGGGKDFMRDRGDREKDLEKWGKVRKDGNNLRDRERGDRGDTNFRDRDRGDREFRDRETERDWGRLRRPGPPPGGLGGGGGGGMREREKGGEGGADHRRPPPGGGGGGGGLASLARESGAPWEDGKGRDWAKLRHANQAAPPSPDRESRPADR